MGIAKSVPTVKSMLIKTFGVLLAFVMGLPLAAAFAAADSYPSKPVHFIIASSPGASTDNVGRLIATKLSERLGKQMVAESRGGAAGSIAAEQVMRAKPDGYTLLFTSSQIVQNPSLYKVEYDAVKSFAPVAKMGTSPTCLVVHPSLPVYSVKEFIALAKQKPGQLLCATGGAGSNMHLVTALFMTMAGIEMKLIHFKGGGPALLDTVGGHTQVQFSGFTTSLGQINAGKLRALGYGGSTRSKLAPDLPTISEAGVPGYEAAIWWAIFAPVGTPKEIVDSLSKEITAIMTAEGTKKTFEQWGADPDLLVGADMVKFIEAEKAKWEKVVKDGNIKAE